MNFRANASPSFAEIKRRKLARFLYPLCTRLAGHGSPNQGLVRRAFAEHRLRFHPRKSLRILWWSARAHVDIAIRKRRAIMQNEEFSALPRFLNFLVKALLLPSPGAFPARARQGSPSSENPCAAGSIVSLGSGSWRAGDANIRQPAKQRSGNYVRTTNERRWPPPGAQ